MKRLMLVPALVLLCACPSEKKAAAPAVAQDTTPVDLGAVKTDIPPRRRTRSSVPCSRSPAWR